jgi:hypothetical protein
VKVRVEIDAAMSAAALSTNDTGASDSSAANSGTSETSERALNHPVVKRFQELFPDAHIRSVRNLNE